LMPNSAISSRPPSFVPRSAALTAGVACNSASSNATAPPPRAGSKLPAAGVWSRRPADLRGILRSLADPGYCSHSQLDRPRRAGEQQCARSGLGNAVQRSHFGWESVCRQVAAWFLSELSDCFEHFDRASRAIHAKAGSDAALRIGVEELALDYEKWAPFVDVYATWPLARPQYSDCLHGRLLVAVPHHLQPRPDYVPATLELRDCPTDRH
jgi:hypothetical protein